jgi:hypothetical protein
LSAPTQSLTWAAAASASWLMVIAVETPEAGTFFKVMVRPGIASEITLLAVL